MDGSDQVLKYKRLRNLLKIFFLGSLLLQFSCKTKTVEPSDVQLGLDYFPVDVGFYWDYEVVQKKYSLGGVEDIDTFYIREMIDPTSFQFDPDLKQINRYRKEAKEDTWSLDSIWTTKRTPVRATRTENNETYVKLVFPVEKEKTWNGNAFNVKDEDPYTYDFVGDPFLAPGGGPYFEDALKVLEGPNDDPNLIETDLRYSVYSRYVGKVYGFYKVLTHQPPSYDTVGIQKVVKLINYGL